MIQRVFSIGRKATPRPIKNAADRAFNAILRRLPLETRLKLAYFKSHQHWPNFSDPKRFSEHCQIVKLSRSNVARFVDKIAVKDFVRERVGERYLIPTLYAGRSLPSVREWPLPFIIKTSHTSGGNIIVRDPPDWLTIDKRISELLNFDYSQAAGEMFYSDIPSGVLVEPLMGTCDALPLDYKFFMFGGVAHAIQVDIDREHGHKRAYFDTDWNRLPIRCLYPEAPGGIAPPSELAQMLEVAKALATGFPFVRVDLYEINGAIYFGEMTLCPEAGMARFEPGSVELEWGSLWRAAL
jgi:TupA-like ATPgrasp